MKRIAEEANEEHHRGKNQLIVEDFSSREEDWKSVDDCSFGNLQLTEKLIVLIRSMEKDASLCVLLSIFHFAKKMQDILLTWESINGAYLFKLLSR